MEAIRTADADTLQDVEGIGPEKAPVVVGQVAALAPVIDKLIAAGVTMTEPRPERAEGAVEGPLSGRTVVVTGKMTGPLEGWGRSEMGALIEKAGGRMGSGVNSRTAFLVAAPTAGGKPGSKAVKAQEAGVEVLTPEDFAVLVADYLE